MIPEESSCKKKRTIDEQNNKNKNEFESTLLPGLPNHLAQRCLAKLQPSLLYNVCMSWRQFIYSPGFPLFLSLYTLLFKISCVQDQCQTGSLIFSCFDPVSFKWRSLPTPPSDPPLIRRHPSFISRIYPIQSVAVSGRLVLIAANTHKFLPALTRPLVFDPSSGEWKFGPPFSTPRRWCVTGSINNEVYVGSGTSTTYNRDVAKSLERWDMSRNENKWSWETRASFKDGRFCREAVEAIRYKDKLFMVNSMGKVIKEGAAYDIFENQWEEVPLGMLAGWNGPAATDDEAMYVVDQEKGAVFVYNGDNDYWERLTEPLERLKGAEHVSAARGKVCVVSGDGKHIVVVDVRERPPKVWELDPPEGMEVVAVHVLPRINEPSNF